HEAAPPGKKPSSDIVTCQIPLPTGRRLSACLGHGICSPNDRLARISSPGRRTEPPSKADSANPTTGAGRLSAAEELGEDRGDGLWGDTVFLADNGSAQRVGKGLGEGVCAGAHPRGLTAVEDKCGHGDASPPLHRRWRSGHAVAYDGSVAGEGVGDRSNPPPPRGPG